MEPDLYWFESHREVIMIDDYFSNPPLSWKKISSLFFKGLTWCLTLFCFYLVYSKLLAAAESRNISSLGLLIQFFSGVEWGKWLLIMIPYSIFFFLIDTHAAWRAIKWFNAPALTYKNIMPIRGSALILSIMSEQVGKGAMSLYLLKRYRVPGWEALSTMIFLGVCEIYQLLFFSFLGIVFYYDFLSGAVWEFPLMQTLIFVFILAFSYIPIHFVLFKGSYFSDSLLIRKPFFHSLRKAHIGHYVLLLCFKAPNLLGAVLVYSLALGLFGYEVSYAKMLVFLPLIFLAAALPLPFHAGALVIWVLLFPEFPEVGIFSLVMHTFFLLVNATIGVLFLPYANKELFSGQDKENSLDHA